MFLSFIPPWGAPPLLGPNQIVISLRLTAEYHLHFPGLLQQMLHPPSLLRTFPWLKCYAGWFKGKCQWPWVILPSQDWDASVLLWSQGKHCDCGGGFAALGLRCLGRAMWGAQALCSSLANLSHSSISRIFHPFLPVLCSPHVKLSVTFPFCITDLLLLTFPLPSPVDWRCSWTKLPAFTFEVV